MTIRKGLLFAIPVLSFLFVLCDEWVKWHILQTFKGFSGELFPLFSITIHKNIGLIFDIPFRMPFILTFSVVVGAALIHLAFKHIKERPEIGSAVSIIIIGALGNLYDRVVYGFTVDYLLFFGRSAINISDIIILCGILWLLLAGRRMRTEEKIDNSKKMA